MFALHWQSPDEGYVIFQVLASFFIFLNRNFVSMLKKPKGFFFNHVKISKISRDDNYRIIVFGQEKLTLSARYKYYRVIIKSERRSAYEENCCIIVSIHTVIFIFKYRARGNTDVAGEKLYFDRRRNRKRAFGEGSRYAVALRKPRQGNVNAAVLRG
jgi:hypothetical protein